MTVFMTTLKRVSIQPLNWAFLLLFPALFALLISISGQSSVSAIHMSFGVVDADNSAMSRTLVEQMGIRYNVVEIDEGDISETLTDQAFPWVLRIGEGYGRDVLSGKEPTLEGYSLTVSDVSALGAVTAQNMTRALMLLGADDEQTLSAWKQAARVDVAVAEMGDNWETISFWLGFFGFISVYTAYFIVRTMMDDKRGGMPERLGVLPHSPRNHLAQGMLAAFCATQITVVLLLVVIRVILGEIPNAPLLFLLLSLYNLFAVGLALAIFSLAKTNAVASIAIAMISTITAMLGGIFWPLEFAPEFMKKIAWFSPAYWLSQGFANIKEVSFEGFALPLLFLLGFTLLVLLLGGWKRIQALDD